MRSSLLFPALLIAGLVAATGAEARETIVTGAGGRSWSHTVNHANEGGGNVSRSTSTTRPNGRTATTDFNRSVSNGTITDTRTTTGFHGGTTSASMTRTPGEGGSYSYTGREGNTVTGSFGPK